MRPERDCLSESEALRLAQQGNAAAFDFLYRRHSPRVYALCLRMVKNPTQAEDLTQETFLAVLRGIREFRGQSAFTTWLHQVTRNTVLMCFRKRRLKETSLEAIAESDREGGRPVKELGIADRRLESIADRLVLHAALAQLSRGFRKALVLHDLHGYEHREVAAILGCATGTSKSQLHKARIRVREKLQKWFYHDRQRQNRAKCTVGADSSSLPSSSEDRFDSERKKTSAPNKVARKVESTIPGWCVPIKADALGVEK
jgi:RNA polymerase sigma-70 factor (ECF subfamily)